MKYIIPLLLMLLAGCEVLPKQPPQPIVPEKEIVQIPPEDLRECDPLPSMEDRAYSQLDITIFLKSWASFYDVCSGRQSRNANTIRKAFNIPKTPVEPSAK